MSNNDLQSWMRHCDKKEEMTLCKTLLAFGAICAVLAFCVFISA